MKYLVPSILIVIVLAGFVSCKHNPVEPKGKDSCDTCRTPCDTCDTTHKPCDTCSVKPMDTTSHNFSWQEYTLKGEGILTGCWVFGPNNIYVVGGSIHKWDGSGWNDITPKDTKGRSLAGSLSGFSLFAFSESDYWLTYAGIAYHVMNGVAQSYQPEQQNPHFTHSSWGTSSSDMYSVGDGGTILHFDGTNWTKMQSGTTKNIRDIWGTSDQNIWAAGYNSTTGEMVMVHYDGGAWSEIPYSAFPGKIGIGGDGIGCAWTVDSVKHLKVYGGGAYLYRNTDLGVWARDSGKISNALGGGKYAAINFIRGNSSNDYFLAGAGVFLTHWNGASWQFYNQYFNFQAAGYDAGALSVNANTVCIAGVKAGQGWVLIGRR